MKTPSIGFLVIEGALVLGLLTGCAELNKLMPKEKLEASSTRVYVANESSNSVSVVDGTTFKPLG